MAVRWDKAKLNEAYNVQIEWGVFAHYDRAYYQAALDDYDKRMLALQDRNLIAGNKQHLEIGAGYGYMIQTIADATNGFLIWGTDIEPDIHTDIQADLLAGPPYNYIASPTSANRVLNIDITAPDAAAQFYAAGAGIRNPAAKRGKFDGLIFSNLVCESFNTTPDPAQDTELQTFLDACEALSDGGAIAHMVTVLPYINAPDLRQMTLEQWRDVRPSHYWIAANERDPLNTDKYRVLGGGA